MPFVQWGFMLYRSHCNVFQSVLGGTIMLVCNDMLRQFTGGHRCMNTDRLVVRRTKCYSKQIILTVWNM